MKYLGIIILFIILSLCYIIARSIAFVNRNIEKSRNEFLSRESKANSTRRQDISDLDYVTIDFNRLPVKEAEEAGCQEYISALRKLSEKKLVNLSMYSNTDLKLMYGAANLDTLSEYDSNYTELIRVLNSLSEALLPEHIDSNQVNFSTYTLAAIQVLEYAVDIGSDISSTYVHLGELYNAKGETDKLKSLIRKARTLTSLSGKTIVKKLSDLPRQ